MDIFFQDPGDIPLPPEEVNIRDLQVEPSADGKRVHVHVNLAPFQKRPNLELALQTSDGTIAARADVIEIMTTELDFTLHIRQTNPSGDFSLTAILFYIDPISPEHTSLPERTIVDEVRETFTI